MDGLTVGLTGLGFGGLLGASITARARDLSGSIELSRSNRTETLTGETPEGHSP
jgi:hypothetical protein